jgi:hypothetical protein
MQAFPNPFGGRTELKLVLDRREQVSCRVYDAAGNLVAVLADRVMDAGEHELGWVAGDAAAGTYFVELRTSAGIRCSRPVKAH